MAQAMTDAIPLMESDGTTGRNNARDMRAQLFASLLAPDSNGAAIRPGVIARNWTSDLFVDMKIIALGTPASAWQMYPGKCWVLRTGQGPYLCSQETTVSNYVMPNADPTNPRIDIVYVRMYDQAIGDVGSHGPYIDHTTGTPAGSPVAPSFPADTVPLAQILRPANTNAITNANITDLRKGTSLYGAPRMMLPGDSTSDPGVSVGEVRRRMATSTQITAGATPYVDEIWTAAGSWTPMNLGAVTQTHAPLDKGLVSTSTFTATRATISPNPVPANPVGKAFVAPTSGKVAVEWAVGIVADSVNNALGLCSIRIGSGSTIGAGTQVTGPSDDRSIQHSGTAGASLAEDQQGRTSVISGLTPGSTYNVQLMYRSISGACIFGRVEVSVIPVW